MITCIYTLFVDFSCLHPRPFLGPVNWRKDLPNRWLNNEGSIDRRRKPSPSKRQQKQLNKMIKNNAGNESTTDCMCYDSLGIRGICSFPPLHYITSTKLLSFANRLCMAALQNLAQCKDIWWQNDNLMKVGGKIKRKNHLFSNAKFLSIFSIKNKH